MQQNTESSQSSEITQFIEQFINQTNRSVFMTGKAGTGKTTLLRKLVKETHKQAVIVAPTGIAALNAGGVTIHSFFQLPFATFIPDFTIPGGFNNQMKLESKQTLLHHFKMNSTRRAIFRNLELLIIDEVSMLRADVLDAMDWTLRNVRKMNTPFGGVQVLYIGDLLQLPPVVKPQEWSYLRNYYNSIYFFNAKSVAEDPPLYIELNKIYRQEDEVFLSILNNLRNNEITAQDVAHLNQYVRPNFDPTEVDDYITLTTHNRDADRMNSNALQKLSTNSVKYTAEVTGNFPEHMFPVDVELELKIGAQVMFIKNDLSLEKEFYNGKMGRIVALESDEIKVSFPAEKRTISVDKYEWENIQYVLDPSTGEVEEKTLGTFVHYPLKLAWAITVHKSQGLTFEKAVLDVSKVFVPGQAYVALSRLRSLEGLILLNPIGMNGLSNDTNVVQYSKTKVSEKYLGDHLSSSTYKFLYDELVQAYDWLHLLNAWQSHEVTYKNQGSKSQKGINRSWVAQQVQILNGTMDSSRKFRNELSRIFSVLNVDLDHAHKRVAAAAAYFFKILDGILTSNLKKMAELQQKNNTKQYNEELEDLDVLLTEVILRIKKTQLLIQAVRNGRPIDKSVVMSIEVRNYKRSKVEMVKREMQESNSTFDFDTNFVQLETKTEKKAKSKKKKKGSTYDTTLGMLKDGMTIEQIANERQLSKGTISTHCARLIKLEKIDLSDVMDSDKRNALSDLFDAYDGGSMTGLKELAGDDFSWDELRLYQASLLI